MQNKPNPIIFIHSGDSDYLGYTLSQAKRRNPGVPLYLIGDGSNDRYKDVNHVHISLYCLSAQKFADIYRHMSSNTYSFELFCFMRWFVLRDFMVLNGISMALYADSDVMLYTDVQGEWDKFSNYDVSICGVAPPVYVNNIHFLDDFCGFLENSYSESQVLNELNDLYAMRNNEGLPGGVCDMTLLRRFVESSGYSVYDLLKIHEGSVYDRNINEADGFVMERGRKKITWKDGEPHGTLVSTGKSVRFSSLHFQGYAKDDLEMFISGNGVAECLKAVSPQRNSSELDNIIPPEIMDDEFHALLMELAASEKVKTILEIGSSAGTGSTDAFVKGLLRNPSKPKLFCVEVSTARFAALNSLYESVPEVCCYNVSSIPVAQFPDSWEIENFYRTVPSGLNQYPLETVLGWLDQDVEYIKSSGVREDGIDLIKQENGVRNFDLVLIDGSEFSGGAELDKVYGASFILLDDVNSFKNHHNYMRLMQDPNYELLRENLRLRNGYAAFRKNESSLPIHFFTIVLNGEPFIRYHIDVFKHLPFAWRWHIVEGVAEHSHDTSWCMRNGGVIDDVIHSNGLSNDGTTEYLNQLKRDFPDNVFIYRKPSGGFWDGKLEMVNAPLREIKEECLLWQIDVDELWTFDQICTCREMFIDNPERTAAFFWCRFFVGRDRIVSSRNCYSQNPQMEWFRTWRVSPGCKWNAHEPPILEMPMPDGSWSNVAGDNPFRHVETEKRGLVFQHYAYVFLHQLRFKERYYGYDGAVFNWLNLQKESSLPVRLGDFFPWVQDDTVVDSVVSQGVVPIPLPISVNSISPLKNDFRIVIDGVFFQYYITGISRVWETLLGVWGDKRFSSHILLLDRGNSMPRVDGYRYRSVPKHDYENLDVDRATIQKICDEEGADLFVSTYYTTPVTTPTILIVHDMLPEIIKVTLKELQWVEKEHAIEYASAYVAVSENTAVDLCRFFPYVLERGVRVSHNGVSDKFYPSNNEEIKLFRLQYNITKPYYLFVGPRNLYKNAIQLFNAFAILPDKEEYCVVCTRGTHLEDEFAILAPGDSVVMTDRLSDDQLRAAYSGATALVYPSLYEGFGLPLLEAMSCGCPVITARNSSLEEVGGDAVLYVNTDDDMQMLAALVAVRDPCLRNLLQERGRRKATHFSWDKMSDEVMDAMLSVIGINDYEAKRRLKQRK